MQDRRVLELLVGGYGAMVLVPAVALAGWSLPVAGAPGAGALAGLGVAVAVVGTLAARAVPALLDRLASLPVAAASVLPPLAYLPYMVVATEPGSTAAAISVVGLLAVLPGIAVPVGAALVRSRRVRASATEIAVVTVGDDDADDERSRALVAGVGLVALSLVVVGVVVVVAGDASVGRVVPGLGGLSTLFLLLADDDGTEVAVTDEGLRIDRSVTRWDDLDGYRVTDDAVELVRSQWYLPTREFDRADIGDEAALVDALGRFLPRLDERGRVEATAGR